MLFAWGAGGGAAALLSVRLRVSRAVRLSRVGVRVVPRGDVLGLEDGGDELSQVFVRQKPGLSSTRNCE